MKDGSCVEVTSTTVVLANKQYVTAVLVNGLGDHQRQFWQLLEVVLIV
jgi:hypothetical protein